VARRDDAFEAWRAGNPVDESTMPGPDSAEGRALFAEITSTPRTSSPKAKYSQRRLLVAIAVAVLALASIAAAWLVFREVSDPVTVACYQAANLESDVVAAASGDALDVSLCEPVWEEGTLVNEDLVRVGNVPPLVGCVTDKGNLAVFPSDDPTLCARLGLAVPAPESAPDGNAIRQLDNELVEYFSQHECQTMEQAERDIREILDTYELFDWAIQPSPGGPERICTSYGLDAPNQTIRLIPIPPPD
jgi:hypothetical protein